MDPENQILSAAVLPNGAIVLEWHDTDQTLNSERREIEKHLFSTFELDHGKALLSIGLIDDSIKFSSSIEFLRSMSTLFTHELLVDPQAEIVRQKYTIELTKEQKEMLCRRVPAMIGAEYVTTSCIEAYWAQLHEAFVRLMQDFTGSVEQCLRTAAPAQVIVWERIHFHLVENKENRQDKPFAFLATYATSIAKKGTIRHVPLGNALKEYGSDTRKIVTLVSTVKKAAASSSLIQSLIDTGELFHPLQFTAKEAYTFLCEVPAYEQVGILCRIPQWWTASKRTVSMALSIGDSESKQLTALSLLKCKPVLHIDGEEITLKEAENILREYDGLALIKGKWTIVDRQSLQKNIDLFRQATSVSDSMTVSFAEALRLLAGIHDSASKVQHKWADQIQCGEWLGSVFEKLRSPKKLSQAPVPKGLQAHLRNYQLQGLNWLYALHELRFGACLADDMGLGKTVQVLSLILLCKEKFTKEYCPSLLVVPASLIDNWLGEIKRFTPGLTVTILHSLYTPDVSLSQPLPECNRADIVITTYAMIRRIEWLSSIQWYYVILDEAQAIKNPLSTQTRAVKQIPATFKVVITGTPLENRLSDLWSLMDFVNQGLLGSWQSFKSFVKNIDASENGYAKLRQVLQPYILRRLKTDKTIIADLPEKIVVKTWAGLSSKQALLYKKLLADLSEGLETADGIKRRGIILSYLLKFKQLCNHPDLLCGTSGFDHEQSGKMLRLKEICEQIAQKRERVLVFTQFAEMVKPLDTFLSEVFGFQGVHMHGGTAVAKRKDVVALFQNAETYVPYFVLSLKAGGVGLNLTNANHVIHFDRWWNPAVENQAEDRAFRIGQKKNVMVHAFICKGTVEEKIDALLEQKRELTEKVLSGSNAETEITEMSNEQIKKLFSLHLPTQEE